MRTLTLLTALVGLALAIGSDGAPKLARRRRDSNFIHFNRDSGSGSQQQQHQHQLLQAANANAQQHEAVVSRFVFPTNTHFVFPTNTHDYEDNDDQIVTGAHYLEGLIQGDFVPGLIYAGQSEAETAPSPRPNFWDATDKMAAARSLPQSSNPASRCILCDAGSCPACYMKDQNGVCRYIYSCGRTPRPDKPSTSGQPPRTLTIKKNK